MMVRELTAEDADAAAALTPGWSAEDYRRTANGDFPDRFCLVTPVVSGLILCSLVPPDAEILNVFVHSSARRSGIATTLLQSALDHMRDRGVTRVWLEVRESNKSALSIYSAAGFRQSGRRVQYYQDPKEDALVLENFLKRS
jgi:ribosomal-protein-alanine N-acetyltransferase